MISIKFIFYSYLSAVFVHIALRIIQSVQCYYNDALLNTAVG